MRIVLLTICILATAAAAGCSKKATGTGAFCAEESFPETSKVDPITYVACYPTSSECYKIRTTVEERGGTASECYPQPEFWCQAVGDGDKYECYIDERDCLRTVEYHQQLFGIGSTGKCSRHTSFPGKPEKSAN